LHIVFRLIKEANNISFDFIILSPLCYTTSV
jgi:hypothetical protein